MLPRIIPTICNSYNKGSMMSRSEQCHIIRHGISTTPQFVLLATTVLVGEYIT